MKTISYICDLCKEELLHYFFKLKISSYKIEKDGDQSIWRVFNNLDVCEKCKNKMLFRRNESE